jgi:hypothetical protein
VEKAMESTFLPVKQLLEMLSVFPVDTPSRVDDYLKKLNDATKFLNDLAPEYKQYLLSLQERLD